MKLIYDKAETLPQSTSIVIRLRRIFLAQKRARGISLEGVLENVLSG